MGSMRRSRHHRPVATRYLPGLCDGPTRAKARRWRRRPPRRRKQPKEAPVIDLGDSLSWGLGLAIVVPLASVALAELSLRLRRSGRPASGPVDQIRNLMLPALGTLVVMTRVVGWERSETAVRLVETLTWL